MTTTLDDGPNKDPTATPDQRKNDSSFQGDLEIKGGNFADGCGLTFVALVFGLPAVWMHWMLRKFADRDEWFDVIVRLILDEMILSLGTFSTVIIVWGSSLPDGSPPSSNGHCGIWRRQ